MHSCNGESRKLRLVNLLLTVTLSNTNNVLEVTQMDRFTTILISATIAIGISLTTLLTFLS